MTQSPTAANVESTQPERDLMHLKYHSGIVTVLMELLATLQGAWSNGDSVRILIHALETNVTTRLATITEIVRLCVQDKEAEALHRPFHEIHQLIAQRVESGADIYLGLPELKLGELCEVLEEMRVRNAALGDCHDGQTVTIPTLTIDTVEEGRGEPS